MKNIPLLITLVLSLAPVARASDVPSLKCKGDSLIQGSDYQYSFTTVNGAGQLTETRDGVASATLIAARMHCEFRAGTPTPGHGVGQDQVACTSWSAQGPATGFSVTLYSDHAAGKFHTGFVEVCLDDNCPSGPWKGAPSLANLACQ